MITANPSLSSIPITRVKLQKQVMSKSRIFQPKNGHEIRLGINGFGRIGRAVTRAILSDLFKTNESKALLQPSVTIVAINDPGMTIENMAYLLKHDTVFGSLSAIRDGLKVVVDSKSGTISINEIQIQCTHLKQVEQIPWSAVGADYICECSGKFCTIDSASLHLVAGAKKVIISAPPKGGPLPTFVVGVNHHLYDPQTMHVVSCASCTTNCLAPLVKVIDDAFGVEEGLATTVHAMTASQTTVDSSCAKSFRLGRSALGNIIPASTGAAAAVALVLPHLSGKLSAIAFRVPTLDVSVVDLTCRLTRPIRDLCDVSNAIEAAAGAPGSALTGIIAVSRDEDPADPADPAVAAAGCWGGGMKVSSDFVGDAHSCVFDPQASAMVSPTFVKLIAWYDNEWAYACRMVDMVRIMHRSAKTIA